jgi:serine/threonine-protein kinase
MSPEQARGRPVDKRTDVWALGCVLYEMLSGARAFEGDDATEVMSSVMKSEPDWNALPADLPPHIRSIVMRCLVKDRKDRVPDVSVVRFALEGTLSASNPAAAAPATAPRWSRILPWAVSALAVAISIWSPWKRPSSEPAPVVYAAIDAPDGFVLGEDAGSSGSLPSRTPIVFTPDGRGLIVLATRPVEPGAKIPEGGRSRLFFRSLDRPDMRLVAGTDGARTPFVSPDGKWIGFWASNELRKVPIDGGAPTTICPLVSWFLGPFGAAWGPDDTIVFGDVLSGRIMRVSANGGTPIAVTAPPSVASRRRHIAPVFLPDGKRILFTDTSTQDAADARIMQQPLEGGAATLVIDQAADGRLLASGQLAFIRLATLMAVPFDSGRAMVQGEPAAVMNNVMQGAMIRLGAVIQPGMAMFAVSSQGTLAALRGGLASVSENLLRWTDPRGLSSAEPAQGAPKGARMNTRIAPDRSRALVAVFTPRRTEMWLADWTRNVWNPCESCDTDLGAAAWSPDGRRLLLGRDGTLLDHALDGSAPDRVLVREPDRAVLPVAWLADGRIVYMSSPNLAQYDLRLLAPGGTSGQVVMPLGFGLNPDISPDGRWLAYNPWTGSGSAAMLRDVVVQAFPGPGARLQVSAGGGFSPFWSKDSKTVYFVNFANELLAVNISPSGGLSATSPKVVLSDVKMCGPVRCADLSEGQRVLTTTDLVKPASVRRIDLVLNWASTLGRK